tara:strand:+ start:434 stop:1189 length:756 start_codon:yes stop_codon:yes gene_type:complete
VSLIKLDNVNKNYFFLKVLKDISLSLSPGKFYGLLGENGAGKSTLFQIIIGLERSSSGSCEIFNYPVESLPVNYKTQMGIVSEKIELDSPLSVKDFFKFYSGYFPNWNQKLFDEIITHQKLDLSKRFNRYSRGQKMQMILAGELAKSPKILLIDEITSVLDVYSRLFFINKLNEFKESGGTIFLTTNVITEIDQHLDHVFILKKGKLVFDGPMSEINRFNCPIVKEDLTLEKFFAHLHTPPKKDKDYEKAS